MRPAGSAGDLAVVRSSRRVSLIGGPAVSLLLSGSVLKSYLSTGSRVVRGLETETRDYPAHVTMADGVLRISSAAYSNGFPPPS